MKRSTAFDMAFDQWPPAPEGAGVRHGVTAPVGAIRLATHGKSRHRQIKVRLDGRPQDRWMKLARFWWVRANGSVPAGMRVGHLDGDTLNDDPHNYALFSPGDVISSWHLDHPKESAAQHRRCARGAARHNRERALVDRQRRWLPERWYAVDVPERRIINRPHRERWQVYAAHGVERRGSANGRGGDGAELGWSGMPRLEAAVLAKLADFGRACGPVTTLELWRAVREVYAARRWPAPERIGSMASAMSRLRRTGWVRTTRGGRRGSIHVLVEGIAQQRGPVCPVVAVKGCELDGDEFNGFERVIPQVPRPGGRGRSERLAA